MNWNYRVVRYRADDEVVLMLTEVYYDEDGTPRSYAKGGCGVSSYYLDGEPETEAIEDMKTTLDRFKEALSKPIVDF